MTPENPILYRIDWHDGVERVTLCLTRDGGVRWPDISRETRELRDGWAIVAGDDPPYATFARKIRRPPSDPAISVNHHLFAALMWHVFPRWYPRFPFFYSVDRLSEVSIKLSGHADDTPVAVGMIGNWQQRIYRKGYALVIDPESGEPGLALGVVKGIYLVAFPGHFRSHGEIRNYERGPSGAFVRHLPTWGDPLADS